MREGGEGDAADGPARACGSPIYGARGVEAEASLLRRLREDIVELDKVRNGGGKSWRYVPIDLLVDHK